MFKNIFKTKKKVSTDGLGPVLYQVIQMGLSSQSELSINSLLFDRLELTEDDLILQYEMEVIFGLMYQVVHAVSHKYESPASAQILTSMTNEFIPHSKEIGATDEQLEDFIKLFKHRTVEYIEAKTNKDLYGPAFWVGKAFLENITGDKQDIADPDTFIKIAMCSDFLTATLVGIDSVLKKYKVKE